MYGRFPRNIYIRTSKNAKAEQKESKMKEIKEIENHVEKLEELNVKKKMDEISAYVTGSNTKEHREVPFQDQVSDKSMDRFTKNSEERADFGSFSSIDFVLIIIIVLAVTFLSDSNGRDQ